jgi:hypothetical protein
MGIEPLWRPAQRAQGHVAKARPGMTPVPAQVDPVPTRVFPAFSPEASPLGHRFFIVLPGPGGFAGPKPGTPDGNAPHAGAVASIRRLPTPGPALSDFTRLRGIL